MNDTETTTLENQNGAAPADAAVVAKNTLRLETLDDDLYAAVKAGDETHVRARLGGSDKTMTEAEEMILIDTRRREDDIAYAHVLEQKAATEKKEEKREENRELLLLELETGVALAALVEGTDVYGGRIDRKHCLYIDRFGGEYDAKGYRFANGSYKTAGGDLYDAAAHTVRFAVGGPDVKLSDDLLGFGADVVSLAIQIAEIRAQARAADDIHAFADSLPSSQPASSEMAGKAAFLKMADSDSFQAAAAAVPGGGLKYMHCDCFTHKDMSKACDIMSENISAGRVPNVLTRYQFKDILAMADDAEDKLAAKLKSQAGDLEMGLPSPLKLAANDAFQRATDVLPDLGFRLTDKAGVFAKKPEALVLPAVANAAKFALRRTSMAMA